MMTPDVSDTQGPGLGPFFSAKRFEMEFCMLVYLLFCTGLVMLLFGGDWLVKGAVGLAEKLSIPPLIIGLTVVAFGTSAPELVVSLKAALSQNGGIAVGNVVGSNIANVLLVLGVPAIFSAIGCADKGMKTNLTFLIILTIIFMAQMMNGPLDRLDGLVLLLGLVAFLGKQFVSAKRHKDDLAEDYKDEVGTVPQKLWLVALLLVAGIITLPLGASITVDAAVEIAQRWNLSDEVIGLTIVAIGTSLPELATGIMAARHNNTSVAVGNVIGSNLFNIAAIMGITAAVAPVPVGQHILNFDMWIMLGTTLLLVALPVFKVTLGRKSGMALAGSYVLYLVVTAIT